jgi:tetratricopeptide (TPR) repeat protein
MKIVALFLLPLVVAGCALTGEFQRERGLYAMQQKDYDLAITCFDRCIKENPAEAAVYADRAYAFECKGEHDKAIADCSQAINLNPKDDQAYNIRGSVYRAKKDYDKAIEDFTQAIRIVAGEPKVLNYCSRGDCYCDKKDYGRAVADYREAIRIDPKCAYAHNDLAWTLATCPQDGVRIGNLAVEHATQACDLSHWRDPNLLDTLAAAYAEVGKFKDAVKWEKKAMALYDDAAAVEECRPRLKLYEAGKAYRDEAH